MYNICAHNSLSASAILALGSLKKKERWWTICVGGQNAFFGYQALRKHILAVLKVATNVDTTVENADSVK